MLKRKNIQVHLLNMFFTICKVKQVNIFQETGHTVYVIVVYNIFVV